MGGNSSARPTNDVDDELHPDSFAAQGMISVARTSAIHRFLSRLVSSTADATIVSKRSLRLHLIETRTADGVFLHIVYRIRRTG
jgi:hypothetical protein